MISYLLGIGVILGLVIYIFIQVYKSGKNAVKLEQNEEVLDDIRKAQVVRKHLTRKRYRERVRKKYTRK